ncbi:membrane protein [Gordoniibacillus kamchatkensis]|uniref:Membrane protein n=1 Tax=Gordoniibacillus kamchatkensis TaxID=1590651 RepID=A0ABR5AD17_9BACL|nr:hypothetical protein [Paenibacillus sp. VKM B-2647]KIL38939.1 membrane protein [Paenibacillus sp. VKM B-2647]
MHIRNGLSALIGLLFMLAPWWFDFSHIEGAVIGSLAAGFVQAVSSILAVGKTGWKSWPNWLSLIAGVWFIIFPFAFDLGVILAIMYLAFGIVTVLLNYYNMNGEIE